MGNFRSDMPHVKKTSTLWWSVFTAALAILPSAMVPAVALARAGGGQGYGGGGGGGFDGGDGGDGFWGLWPLLFLGHGSWGGLVTLFIILYIIRQARRGKLGGGWGQLGSMMGGWGNWGGGSMMGSLGDVLDPSPPAPGWHAGQSEPPRAVTTGQSAADGIAAIKAKDPNFDERAFLDRAQTTFFKVQQAWAARNQDLARDCVSDALYERHKMQTDQLIANHQIDVLENIVIGNAHIMSATPGNAFDSIVVAFTASMTDYTVDENTRQVVSGNQYRQTFTEFWTFIRRADAKSSADATALAAACASCGAPLKLVNGKCEYCGAYARTTAADWVVDTIEQP